MSPTPKSANASRIRLGVASLAVAGILFVLYPAIRPFSDETSLQGAAAFASTAWILAHMLAMVGFTLLPLGLLGLHSSLHESTIERLAFRSVVSWEGRHTAGASRFGDPRINRTKPGPGRPPLWWKQALARNEGSAIDLIGGVIAEGHRRLKQRGKKAPEGFVESDPRINRTKPGPGRPPLWWKHQISRYEETAIALIGAAIDDGLRRLRKRGKGGIRHVHLAAAQAVLDRLHGRATQSVEVLPPVDVSGLPDEELDTLNRLLARVLVSNGAGGKS